MPVIDGYPVGIDREDAAKRAAARMGVMHAFVGPADFQWPGLLAGIKGADGLPPWGTRGRDVILRQSTLVNGMWGSAVMMGVTKIAARGYKLDEENKGRLRRAKAIIESYGPGWVRGLKRGMQDYLLTNLGQVIGIERAANAPGARVTGIFHIDSLRCWPTNWPEYPLLYTSPRTGRTHLLPDWGVIQISDMTHPGALAGGYGQCAADRAWETILIDTAVQTYFREKVSGTRNLAIHLIKGVSYKQLDEALTLTDEGRKQKNFLLYKGSTIIPFLSDQEPTLVTIPLAEIPDGFDPDATRRDIYLRYANAIGMFVGELQPLSGQGLGTGTQTVVLDEAAEGRGLASYVKELPEQLNRKVVAESTTFAIYTNDIRDQKAKAEVQKIRAETRALRIQAGEITPQEARQLAADDGDIPPELMQQDMTPGGAITDQQKPVTDEAASLLEQARARLAATPPPAAQPASKEARRLTVRDLLSDEALIAAARALANDAG